MATSKARATKPKNEASEELAEDVAEGEALAEALELEDTGSEGEGNGDAQQGESRPGRGNVLKNTLTIVWHEDEDAGVTTVTMGGDLVFEVAEHEDERGETVYRSTLFRSDQDDQKDAIAVALKNAANRAFRAAWDEIYPPEKRERARREKQSEMNARLQTENERLKAVQDELMAAMLEGRTPDIAKLRELGADLAAYGLGELVAAENESSG
jgi:hypothetical protein